MATTVPGRGGKHNEYNFSKLPRNYSYDIVGLALWIERQSASEFTRKCEGGYWPQTIDPYFSPACVGISRNHIECYVMFVWALKAIFQPSPRFKNTRRFQLVGFAEGLRP